MPSLFWRKPDNKLKKCSERRVDVCDTTPTDLCCEVIACDYCLTWQEYRESDVHSTASFGTDSWVGTVGPIDFRGYWERGYESGECEFVVTANDTEVYRKSCYGGQSCRDSSDETDVSLPYIEGHLTWTKILRRPLPLDVDPDTGCKDKFCGDCNCTCGCLCVTVIDGYTGETSQGELCDANYECDGPVWQGMIGDVDIVISLERDQYMGECFLAISGDGEEFEVAITDCTAISFSVEMYDGTVIRGSCKTCACFESTDGCCPPGTCYDSVFLTVISSGAKCACLVGETLELFQDLACAQTWSTRSATIKTCDDVVLMSVSASVTCVVVDGVSQWLMTVTQWSRCTLVGTNPPAGGCGAPSDACTVSLDGFCPPSATFCFEFSGLDCCDVFNAGEQVCFELSI